MKDIFDLISELRGKPLSEEERLIFSIRADIAGKLLAYRKKYNLTQRELAKKLEMPLAHIERIETGIINLSIRELVDIAVKLGGNLKIELDI